MSEETQKTYHAVENNGVVTAVWEMVGRRHVRTIDPRSQEGKALLAHYTPAAEAQPAAENLEQMATHA
ncbi:MAG TPA: hypothetical protein PLL06_06475 [Acidobacteriota bacterium]|nr:hypothetical protein [Acidobacteriota bacterium]HMZ79325.1 hypothetical protein [Acidobacteriota bacterium]HNB73539.1 hypothetical protein [Acidobacteriota bacterium]HNC45330.1 hypothetical protein [Acidobacteriota bacterium]HND21787.1 hypothetical protein [Acidobacteriota bacterium]